MLWIYNLGILLYAMIVRMIAPFNDKARLFTTGRKNIFKQIADRLAPGKQYIWFHFASLGEFEQGRPVMEGIRQQHPEKHLCITFFSPSGYEVRKDYALADGVFYLPLDTAANAKKFIALVKPEIAVFTKYEFWHHYFSELSAQNIPLYVISANFRKDQVFFRWYGGFYRKILQQVSWFYLQNDKSRQLLASIGINNISVTGDTRFDRVSEHAANPRKNEVVAAFCKGNPVLVCGSTWPAEEKLLAALPREFPAWKFVIAPHEINQEHIDSIATLFPGSIRLSRVPEKSGELNDYNTLIIDNIGMLSALYQYGSIAYIGGAFGSGLHNILEAAAFGLPVIFGPKINRFPEAGELIAAGGARSISDGPSLVSALVALKDNPAAAVAAKNYINSKKGATNTILKDIFQHARHSFTKENH